MFTRSSVGLLTLLMLAAAPAAFASGTKTIVNNTPYTIAVRLYGRVGASPGHGNLPPVSAVIAAGQSKTLQYGSDSDPYLNILHVAENSNGSTVTQDFITTQTGGPGTLDNLFNANGTLILNFQAATYNFLLSASN
jgi:hypothetical protein